MIRCKSVMLVLLLVLAAMGLCVPCQAKDPKRPNIVLIMADDVSRDWFSCYGSANKTKIPASSTLVFVIELINFS